MRRHIDEAVQPFRLPVLFAASCLTAGALALSCVIVHTCFFRAMDGRSSLARGLAPCRSVQSEPKMEREKVDAL